MLELRTYTLASIEALDLYGSVHWERHITSLAEFGITTHHVWRQIDADKPRLIALVEYRKDDDPKEVTGRYMNSAEFHADMSGFPMDWIIDVKSVFVVPAAAELAIRELR